MAGNSEDCTHLTERKITFKFISYVRVNIVGFLCKRTCYFPFPQNAPVYFYGFQGQKRDIESIRVNNRRIDT